MAHITLKQPGQSVADFAVQGATVTVAGVAVDCAERQQDVAVSVEIRQNAGGPSEGGAGAYLAQIHIPARRYTSSTGQDAEGKPTEVRTPQPLDPHAVAVTLWPIA